MMIIPQSNSQNISIFSLYSLIVIIPNSSYQISNIFLIMLFIIIIFLSCAINQSHSYLFTINLEQIAVDTDTTYFNVECQRNLTIDFQFSENSQMQCNDRCTVKGANQSSLKIFDKDMDQHLDLKLQYGEFVNWSFIDQRKQQQRKSFAFCFKTQPHTFYVIIPITQRASEDQTKIDLTSKNLQRNFETLQSFKNLSTLSQQVSLTPFNFMNKMDLGLFYKVGNPATNTTVLMSIFSYYMPHFQYFNQAIKPQKSQFPTYLNLDYQSTALRACFGSQTIEEIFVTHLADNYPLWTGWMGLLFFWGYYLITNNNTNQCFQRKFQRNKWTSWSVYSLFYLGHDQFFSKLSRVTIMMFTFSFQALMVSIILYNMANNFNGLSIIWIFIIVTLLSQPIPFMLGCVFLRKGYHSSIEKFQSIERLNYYMEYEKPASLRQKHELQIDILQKEQKVYQIYFLFYALAITEYLVCWTVSIHLMQQTYEGDSHLHPYWVYTTLSAWMTDVWVIEPLLTLCFGDKKVFEMRGFYYNFDLGQGYLKSKKQQK